MSTDLARNAQIVPASDSPHTLATIAPIAAEYAAAGAFAEYARRKTPNTIRAQHADLATFCTFLETIGVPLNPDELQAAPGAWHGISHGVVQAFREWMLRQGYAIATCNRKLATVRVYTSMAHSALVVDQEEHLRIQAVHGYSFADGQNIDANRTRAEIPTRVGRKAHDWYHLNNTQRRKLLDAHDDTPQGRRDRLLLCLGLEHGLRAGEIADLQVKDFDLTADPATMTFYRKKVKKTQTHNLSDRTRRAAKAYFTNGDALAAGPLLRASRKDGQLTTAGMSEQAIYNRVRYLGEVILHLTDFHIGPHVLRHSWATAATKAGTSTAALRQAGGWNSPVMAIRYYDESEIANEEVQLPG